MWRLVRVPRRLPILHSGLGVVLLLGACASPAAAQTQAPRPDPLLAPPPGPPSAKWTFELRGGFGAATSPAGRPGQLPPAGSAIQGTHGVPVPRSAPSFFFGDGAAQWNGVFPDAPMQPIDAILQSPLAHRARGSAFGVTVGRRVSTRWSADVGLDLAFQSLSITSAARTGMQQAVSAYAQAFPPLGGSASATIAGTTSAGWEWSITGGTTYWLDPGGRFRKFLTVGGGAIVATAGPVTTLTGLSTLVVPFSNGQAVFSNTDHVALHANDAHVRPMAYVGGGFERAVTEASGVRLLLRAGFAPARVATTMDAAPTFSRTGPSDAFVLSSQTDTIVFSNSGAVLPTLSAPSVKGLQTFRSSGVRVQAILSAGYFFRF